MLQSTKELDTSMQIVLLNELFHLNHLVTITTNDEVHMLESRNNFRNQSNQEVNTFAILQAADVHDIDDVLGFFSPDAWIRRESQAVNGIWYREASIWVELGTKAEVVLTGLTHAYCCIQVSYCPLAQLVQIYSCHVVEPEERVLREDSLEAVGFGSHRYALLNDTRGLMAMADVNVLSDEDLAYHWECLPKSEESDIPSNERNMRQMITLQAIGHVAYSSPAICKFITHEANLVSSLN